MSLSITYHTEKFPVAWQVTRCDLLTPPRVFFFRNFLRLSLFQSDCFHSLSGERGAKKLFFLKRIDQWTDCAKEWSVLSVIPLDRGGSKRFQHEKKCDLFSFESSKQRSTSFDRTLYVSLIVPCWISHGCLIYLAGLSFIPSNTNDATWTVCYFVM